MDLNRPASDRMKITRIQIGKVQSSPSPFSFKWETDFKTFRR